MSIQYITDSTGKTTGVYIPIEEWEKNLKDKYEELIQEVVVSENQQREVLERLESYRANPDQARDFEAAMDEIDQR